MNEISEKTSSELIPTIKEFYDSLFDPKKRFTTLKEFDDVKDGGKVSLFELNAILQEIMEQAEGQFKEWRA